MNWDRWDQVKLQIPNAIHEFISKCDKEGLTPIIESGTNEIVNGVLSEYKNVTTIVLEVPSNEVLIKRAKERNLPASMVLQFKDKYLRKHSDHELYSVTQEEAALIIKAKLISRINIGVIGTAGRGEDKSKMSRKLYMRMCNYVIHYINKLQLKPKEIQLVSGGAAWADHVAVSLRLAKKANQLLLHLPSQIKLEPAAFYGCCDANTANYYHQQFSKVMGGNTLDGIARAIKEGAKVQVTEGFKPRNLQVAADSDILIAFTWGESKDKPKDGGTSHTWNNSKAKVKIHVPLKEL
jgi:hypothetical protein